MKRRQFLKSSAITGCLVPALGFKPSKATKTHLVTFSFDDGFKKSFLKLADIHENFRLKGCFNIIASGHLPEFEKVDDWILPELMGDFDDWNSLVSRGHEVMPHSWQHLNLGRQEPDEAKRLISKCIDYFNLNLRGFDPKRAIFNFPFNSSTPDLEQYTLGLLQAVRTWGDGAINPFPSKSTRKIIGCASNGPNNIDAWVDDKVNSFLATDGGWLVLNLHGLDYEGWGPVSTNYFIALLEKLVTINKLEITPTGMALEKYA